MSAHITPAICDGCDQYAEEDIDLCLGCLETTCVGCGARRHLDVFGQCDNCAGAAT